MSLFNNQCSCQFLFFSSSTATLRPVSLTSTIATCKLSIKTFTLTELEKATDCFGSDKILGERGFGHVYHGTMEDGSEAAIKLLIREDQSGDHEFIVEVEMLSQLHHCNLVKLIGICIEDHTCCLVYELVSNGSVETHLLVFSYSLVSSFFNGISQLMLAWCFSLSGIDKRKGPLGWDVWMKVALCAARGLAYLHEDSNPRVIHSDFKASNIFVEKEVHIFLLNLWEHSGMFYL